MISFFQNSLMMLFLTPHSATLHVGLKSGVLSGLSCRHHPQTPHSASLHVGLKSLASSGHLRNIGNYYFSTVKLDIVTLFLSVTSACVNRAIAR
ncbi:hypothetical protein Barb4_02393 [Bacteroidales bacterium Barb4]|nr:hypothetical protein Barb4_02393 [Bacteroidales bacterium Barb4]